MMIVHFNGLMKTQVHFFAVWRYEQLSILMQFQRHEISHQLQCAYDSVLIQYTLAQTQINSLWQTHNSHPEIEAIPHREMNHERGIRQIGSILRPRSDENASSFWNRNWATKEAFHFLSFEMSSMEQRVIPGGALCVHTVIFRLHWHSLFISSRRGHIRW